MRVPETPDEMLPDTKDWTWVLDRACPDCGLDSGSLRLGDVPQMLRESSMIFGDALRAGPRVAGRVVGP